MEENTPNSTHPQGDNNDVASGGSASEVSPTGHDLTAEELAALDREAVDAIQKAALEKVSNLSGRKFGSWEDYEKHYKGVSQLAFSKTEKPMDNPTPNTEEVKKLSNELEGVKAQMAREQFLRETPQALNVMDLVSKVAKADNVDLATAWNSVKDLAEAKLAREEALAKEQEPGVTGSRLSPEKTQRIEEISKALEGTTTPSGHHFPAANRRALEAELVKEALPDVIADLQKRAGV